MGSQMWSEPDIDRAVDAGRRHGRFSAGTGHRRAVRRDVRLGHGYRAVGGRILQRVREIAAEPVTSKKVQVIVAQPVESDKATPAGRGSDVRSSCSPWLPWSATI